MNIQFEEIPEVFQLSAIRLRGEFAWKLEDAMKLINWLSSVKQLIVGVEYWHVENRSPKWIATSNFEHLEENQNVLDYAKAAKEFVTRFGEDPKSVFNVDWENLE